ALRLAYERAKVEQKKRAYIYLARDGAKALVNVLPASARGGPGLGRGARVIASTHELAELRTALDGPFDADLADVHLISQSAWEAYRTKDFQAFLQARDRDLETLERRHFDRVRHALGLT